MAGMSSAWIRKPRLLARYLSILSVDGLTFSAPCARNGPQLQVRQQKFSLSSLAVSESVILTTYYTHAEHSLPLCHYQP